MNNITQEDEKEKTRFILQRYKDRLKVLRLGQEHSQKDDIPNAVKAYVKYLQALADYFDVEEKNLRPSLFQKTDNIVEILMVSQVYWDLSKAYDRAPKLTNECQRCLNQFILFSLGFKFQYLNSEMLRKYLKRRVAHNPKLFEAAYDKMRDNSKKCYIATHCFGEESQVVINLRSFKALIQNNSLGKIFIDLYYYISIRLVHFAKKSIFITFFINILIRPLLVIFSKVLEITKFNK